MYVIQRDRALPSQLHTFIELLSNEHRALGGKVQAIGRFLLQLGSNERGTWAALALFARDRIDHKRTRV